VVALPIAANDGRPAAEGPKKVWICHNDGHSGEGTFGAGPTGDDVINYQVTGNWCETHGGGGMKILVSVNSLGDDDLERVTAFSFRNGCPCIQTATRASTHILQSVTNKKPHGERRAASC